MSIQEIATMTREAQLAARRLYMVEESLGKFMSVTKNLPIDLQNLNKVKRTIDKVEPDLANLKQLKRTAEDAKKTIETVIKKVPGADTAAKALGASNMLGALAVMGAQAGISAFAAWVSNYVQDVQDRYLDKLSTDLTKANGRSLANTDLIRKQQEQINGINKKIATTTDKIYAEAAGAVQNATVAREKANEALYETRANKPKLEAQIADAKKQSNDALYETRAGRTKLELQIADAKKQSNDALYETRAGRTKLEAQIADAKKQSNDAFYETRAGRTKLEAQIADAKKQSNDALYETRAGRIKLEAQIGEANKQSNDALYETRAGRTKLEAQIADANKQTRGQQTELLTLEKEVRQFTVQTQAELEKNKVGLNKTKVDVENNKADLNKTKFDVEKTKADLDKTKLDVEKVDTKVKEQEKVNKEAIPKLDQILGILPFIPARTADVIRPSIPTVPQIENAAKTGTCQTFQPGGCGANALNGLGNGINQNTNNQSNNLFDKINAGANAAQLALLKIIDNKLGAQIVGGISGKLVAGFQWLQLDRALNVLTFAATIQNHVMLSNNIAETLFGAFENILKIIGFKDDEGKPFSLSSSIEALVKGIVGKENYTVISETWAKANRIYQATTNVLNAFQNISSTILSGLELVAGQTGKIGNALRKSGEVLETAYGWMNPQPKINRVTQTLENLNQGASTIQQITQVPLDTIEALTGLQTANTEFVKALQEDDKPENKSAELPEPAVLKAVEKGNKAVSAGKNLADVDKEEDE